MSSYSYNQARAAASKTTKPKFMAIEDIKVEALPVNCAGLEVAEALLVLDVVAELLTTVK